MILETIVTTQSRAGIPHIAPMGLHTAGEQLVILPFKPSVTLDNILASGHAVVNYTDDVRIFAGCLTGRRDWPLTPAQHIQGQRLQCALSHTELVLEHVEDSEQQRPKLFCDIHCEVNHTPFRGFNRAQFSVLEAAILISRLEYLSWDKIQQELDYLGIGLNKTAGARELEAWGWLLQRVEDFKRDHPHLPETPKESKGNQKP